MKVHIIGGGVIGLCTAWFLRQEGCEVTVIDQNAFPEGTSYGNAGLIVPSHFVPLASPGVVRKAVNWIFNRHSPFSVKPRLSPEFIMWLYRFYGSCTHDNVRRASSVLKEFHEISKKLYSHFPEKKGLQFNLDKKGLLMIYQTDKAEKEELQTAEKAGAIGIETQVLDNTGLLGLEKNMRISARGGVFYPGDAHLDPRLFMEGLNQLLKSSGVRFISQAAQSISRKDRKIVEIVLSDNTRISPEEVVISAGSWSPRLVRQLGYKLLLQPGKGYSITDFNPKRKPSIPSILSEAKVAITPMGDHLRIGGTLEIGNFSDKISKNRLKGILRSVPQFYPEIDIKTLSSRSVWQGFRPCTPDGLPYIGRMRGLTNLTVATGHAMMGVSLGPATGLLVSEIISGKLPSIDLSLFNPGRFG